jgi:hypothetical protein
MTVGAVNSTSASEARTELERYQQRLAADLAAKAADRVIAVDQPSVTKAERAVRQDERGGGSAVDISA